MEFVPGGDLGKFISQQGHFTEFETRTVSNQLLSALGYLHANNITHRDVKPDNILINSLDPIDVKLTDFGLSKMVDSEQTFLRTFCGTLLYCAPEVYTEYAEYDEQGVRSRGKKVRRMPGQRYNHAVDIWSLGGVLFYALTGAAPFPVKTGVSYSELLHRIMTTRLNILPLQKQGVTGQGIDFLQRMLQNRPENRATVADLVAHPWSGNTESTIAASQSYDEITDDEDMVGDLSQFQKHFELDRISDSEGDESEKENYTFRPGTQPARLFGEVGVSAIGSSGVIPEDYLNLPSGHPSLGETEILGSEMDEAYQSSDGRLPQDRRRRVYRQTTASIAQNQSDDQLQSLVEDVASQSLGGNDSVVHNLGHSGYAMQSMEFNSSKRKPPSTDTSNDFDENTPPGKPQIKRLKSEGTVDLLVAEVIEEYKLLASIPQVVRSGSGRQMDNPVTKTSYWAKDMNTWHLEYPEMTQLQYLAFQQAAKDRSEDFGPGKTPLWDIAMKYFPPTPRLATRNGNGRSLLPPGVRHDDRMIDDNMEFPPTAPPLDQEHIPDTLPPDTGIVVPVPENSMVPRMVGIVESHPDSSVKGISFSITDSLVSFGRGLENTDVFHLKTESRVPKFAMKILLWKDGDGYDPSKDSSKVPHPWLRNDPEDPDLYSFYISTKATSGIHINGYILGSKDVKNPGSPSQCWTKIYNGDSLVIWGHPNAQEKTKVTFRCFWGGSSRARGEDKRLELAPPALAQRLDIACQRTEKRIRETREAKRKRSAAQEDLTERGLYHLRRERERTQSFEAKRQEAITYLLSKQAQGSRRGSPASAPPTTRMQAAQFPRISPDNDAGLSAR